MRRLIVWCVAFAACKTPEVQENPTSATCAAALATTPATTPQGELDQLDQRKPVPLLPAMAHHQMESMRDHLVAVHEVVAGTADGDFARVAEAARRIGYSEPMAQMCKHIGANTPGFTEQALTFHHAADRITDAAAREDSTAVLQALAATLATCTACHATYKQKLVDRL